MTLRFLPSLAAAAATLLLPSCVATRFYNKVDSGGKIVNKPRIDWQKPDWFIYRKEANPGFKFVRYNGDVIVPETILTDGGSVPRLLWASDGYSPWTYGPAYLVHDWLYEANRRGIPAAKNAKGESITYDKKQADWIMAEAIKSQMEDKNCDTKVERARMLKIYWAVSRFGHTAWTDQAHPVTAEMLGTPVRLVNRLLDETIDALPLSPVLDTLKNQITPVPGKPKQSGTPVAEQPASAR